MLIEFTDSEGQGVLVNAEQVTVVREETRSNRACIIVGADIRINVRQTFEEIKKRLGMAISPRAETIARIS